MDDYAIKRERRRTGNSKKKIKKEDIIEVAIQDLGLTYEELLDTTPAELYRLQLFYLRKQERRWEIAREVIAMIHNGSMNARRAIKGRDIIELSFDNKKSEYEWDDDLVRRMLKVWN